MAIRYYFRYSNREVLIAPVLQLIIKFGFEARIETLTTKLFYYISNLVYMFSQFLPYCTYFQTLGYTNTQLECQYILLESLGSRVAVNCCVAWVPLNKPTAPRLLPTD